MRPAVDFDPERLVQDFNMELVLLELQFGIVVEKSSRPV